MTHVTDPLTLLIAFVLGTVGVARVVRLITSDAWPPIQNIRLWWVEKQETGDYLRDQRDDERGHQRHPLDPRSWRSGWGPLLTCPFCCAPYVTAIAVAITHWAGVWAPDLGTIEGWWWTLAVWAAVSYLAAMLVVRDEPEPVEVD